MTDVPVEKVTLTEHQTSDAVRMTHHERGSLREVAPSISVAPAESDGTFTLTPGSEVGAVEVGSRRFVIRPKLPIDRLLFLLGYSLDPKRWMTQSFDFSEETDLFEAVIPGFVAQVNRAFARGLLQGYRTEDAALPGVRGRIRFADQLRDRFGIAPPIEVTYDEFTEDIEVNRIIKAALERLGRLRIRSAAARQQLRHFDGALQNVTLAAYDSRQLPEVRYTRLNAHYEPAVELAKLVLRSTSLSVTHGDVRASSFLVDMSRVFEDFVVTTLREALGLSARSFAQGAAKRSLYLDEGRRISLKPDISWWEGKVCILVGDVKYKRVRASGVLHPDLYQLLAYTVATDLPIGLLIYAASEDDPVVHEIVHLARDLEVTTLDLRGTPDEVLLQVAHLANRLRTIADEGRRRRSAA